MIVMNCRWLKIVIIAVCYFYCFKKNIFEFLTGIEFQWFFQDERLYLLIEFLISSVGMLFGVGYEIHFVILPVYIQLYLFAFSFLAIPMWDGTHTNSMFIFKICISYREIRYFFYQQYCDVSCWTKIQNSSTPLYITIRRLVVGMKVK